MPRVCLPLRIVVPVCVALGLGSCAGGSGSGASATPARQLDVALQILSPARGDVLVTPLTIRYRIDGPDAAAVSTLVVFVGDPASSDPIELPIADTQGEVSFAVSKLLTGKRDLTFRLGTAGGGLVDGVGAVVVVPGVVIQGPR